MRVFLVDDDPKALIVISKMLEEANIEGAFSMNSPEDLVEKIKDYKPDVIILDLYMPEVGGIELYQRIRNEEFLNNTPIIALSATDDMRDRLSVIRAGFNHFLSKPIDRDKLINSIKTQVRLSYLTRQCEEALKVMEHY